MNCLECVNPLEVVNMLSNCAECRKKEGIYKTFLVQYTEDVGKTFHSVLINADSITDAYVKVDLTLKKDGAITGLFEII